MILLMLASLWLAPTQDTSTVRVEFSQTLRRGDVIVALFDSAQSWERGDTPLRSFTGPASSNRTVVFEGLAPGRYGIMVFHDENRDGGLNTVSGGLPTEAFGFSRNARGMYGRPSWDSAAFEVSGETVQRIRMR